MVVLLGRGAVAGMANVPCHAKWSKNLDRVFTYYTLCDCCLQVENYGKYHTFHYHES